jgi:hypothetical protein
MKRVLLLALFIVCTADHSNAQASSANDTIYRVELSNYDINSTRLWANDTVRYRYNQMKHYVTIILPYLNEAVAIFNEINARLNEEGLKGKARREYIRGKEAIVRSRFEDRIKTLNETQGVLLIKLVARQTGYNLYEQLADFKGSVPAMKWQLWAKNARFQSQSSISSGGRTGSGTYHAKPRLSPAGLICKGVEWQLSHLFY